MHDKWRSALLTVLTLLAIMLLFAAMTAGYKWW